MVLRPGDIKWQWQKFYSLGLCKRGRFPIGNENEAEIIFAQKCFLS
jgi:hypothetical protein